MGILFLGAGGIGGYFGARIHEAGGDVTFLVRPARAEQLKKTGLKVSSPFGDMQIVPRIVTSDELHEKYDVIVISCKAYDLDSAMDAIAPAVGKETAIIPLLNGVLHIDTLSARFGSEHVLGGVAAISAMLAPNGEIKHLNKMHRFVTGARTAVQSRWLEPLTQQLSKANFDFILSDTIEQAMWDKIVFLTALAGASCTLRASVGHILDTLAGEAFINGLLAECASIAAANGRTVSETQLSAYQKQLTEKGSGLVPSMLRDVENGGPTEANHILGDMVARAQAKGVDAPLLRLAYSHLQAYDLRRNAAA